LAFDALVKLGLGEKFEGGFGGVFGEVGGIVENTEKTGIFFDQKNVFVAGALLDNMTQPQVVEGGVDWLGAEMIQEKKVSAIVGVGNHFVDQVGNKVRGVGGNG